LVIPSDTTDQNSFDSSLGGTLPWGLQYLLSGNLNEQYGRNTGATNSIPFDNSGGGVNLQLTQPLLKDFWIDSTRESISLDRNKLKYSEQGLRSQLITSITAVENAYYELIYAQENVRVQEEALNVANQQLSDDKRRVQIQVLAERGGTLEQDQSQVAQNRANLITAQYTLENDENALKNLITDDYNAWHDIDIQPADHMEAVQQLFDVQDSWSLGLSLRPDYLQAKLSLENQGIVLKFDRNQLFPSLDVVGSYGFNGEGGREFSDALGRINDGTQPNYTYGAQLSMPLSNVGARNALKSDKVTAKQLLIQLKQTEQNVMVDIDNAVKNAQSSWESLDATRQARIYAEVALSAEQGKYAAGKSTTFTVLQLQNNVTSARSQEVRALANYNEALTALAQKEGSTLRHRNIDIEVK
jgi:outer membrane protein